MSSTFLLVRALNIVAIRVDRGFVMDSDNWPSYLLWISSSERLMVCVCSTLWVSITKCWYLRRQSKAWVSFIIFHGFQDELG